MGSWVGRQAGDGMRERKGEEEEEEGWREVKGAAEREGGSERGRRRGRRGVMEGQGSRG